MASSENPLTARVLVNRVWRWHFGQGIVSTTDNFGLLGGKPSHPELLDWLARNFIEAFDAIAEADRELPLDLADWYGFFYMLRPVDLARLKTWSPNAGD